MAQIQTFINALPGDITQGLIWGLLAIGVYITYKVIDVADLTVDGTLAFGGAVLVVLVRAGIPVGVAMVCAFVAGCFAGLCTGLLHTMLGIPAILAGILTQISLYSINVAVLGGANLALSSRNYSLLVSSGRIFPSLAVVLVFNALIIAALYWFFGTEYGMTLRATGCNRNMSRAQGINTKKSTVIALILSNGLVGVAGGLLSQFEGNADVNKGRGAIVIGLAAVIIGEVLGEIAFKKHFNFVLRLSFTALGAIIYFVVMRIVLVMGLPSHWTKALSAVIVALFLGVPYLRNAALTSFRKAEKSSAAALNNTEGK
ncbi:MAG: ABC transporter permease [Oscillospiraceae bacterium]|nr:ABC transporter permease [Oscillospiraceae bacterium]